MKAVEHHYNRIRSLALLCGGWTLQRIQGINGIRCKLESKIPCRFIIHKIHALKKLNYNLILTNIFEYSNNNIDVIKRTK
ncbi:MAG TPA: hypothetical protein VFY41_07580 [Nitrososphaeraceae archaeon]|nr:hypothetical protein [Nitrososphaeraceae archaeon]